MRKSRASKNAARAIVWASVWCLGVGLCSSSLRAELKEIQSGDGWSLQIDITPQAPRLSDTVTLSVAVEADKRLNLEEPICLEFPHSFRLDQGPSDETVGNQPNPAEPSQRRIYRWEYKLTPLDTGELSLPRIVIPYSVAGSNGEDVGLIAMPEIPLPVTTLIEEKNVDPSKFDLQPHPMLVPSASNPWLWIAGTVGGASLLLLGYLFKRTFMNGSARLQQSSEAIAEFQLNELEREKLPASGRAKEYVSRLTDIVRNYIEAKTTLAAPEQTTEEFVASIQEDDRITGEVKDNLKDFLQTADLVKFAGQSASDEIVDRSFSSARRLIRPDIWSRFLESNSRTENGSTTVRGR